VNVRRTQRAKNETTYFTRIPASYTVRGVMKLSSAATLVGIETPPPSRNFEIKPYGITELTTNREVVPQISNDWTGNFGFDAKYGVTKSLTADFTYNTDFAQVEADDQQVNLTRFSLLFPEKREFFLEGQGIFGIAGARGGGDMPILFFSRRIGLNNGRTVPIRVGGRLTGRAGKYTLGLLDIQTEDAPLARAAATNFSVARVKRDILRRSSIGVIATSRTPSVGGRGSGQTIGADLDLSFFQDLQITSFIARSLAPGSTGDTSSYQAELNYSGDRYGVQAGRLKVGERFNPEVGFLRRTNFVNHNAYARFSPRISTIRGLRKIRWDGAIERAVDNNGVLETREAQGSFGVELENGDVADVTYASEYEFLAAPFTIAPGVIVPAGGYPTQEFRASYTAGPQRWFDGNFSVVRGSFYGGDRTQAGYNGRVQLASWFSVEPRLSFNWVYLPEGDFVTTLLSSRINYTMTPRAAIGALFQYNSSQRLVTTDARFRWEFRPGSDFFIVYNEGRNPDLTGPSTLNNRKLAIKITRLLRF
jgi:hypothetical protein